MSSYSNIRKIQYTKNPSDVVALKEYIIFEDGRDEEKFIVFKFVNNLNQSLLALKFEVLQFDAENKLLEKSEVLYDKFVAEANSPFVPNAKLKVNFACESVCVNLIFAAFDRVKWERGEFRDNTYKFDSYAYDVSSRAPVINQAATGKTAKPVKTKAKKSKSKKETFGVKCISKKNLAKFPVVFNILFIILVAAFVAASLIYFRKTSSKIQIEGFDLQVISEDTAGVLGYDGNETELVIPEKLGDYTVVKINGGAFEKSKIKSVSFETGDIVVENGAFNACGDLTTVTSSAGCGTVTLMDYAFYNCAGITDISLPSSVLSVSCFGGSESVKNLSFGRFLNTRSASLSSLFDGKAVKLDSVTANVSRIGSGFFGKATVGKLVLTNADCTAEYGALTDAGISNCTATDYCEAVDGKIISVNVVDGFFAIPAGIKAFNPANFAGELSGVTGLSVESARGELNLNTQFLSGFRNLTRLEVKNDILSAGALAGRGTLSELSVPVLSVPLKDVLKDTAVNKLTITGSTPVSQAFTAGLTGIAELEIMPAVPSVDNEALEYIGFKKLSIPVYGNLNFIKGLENVTELELTASQAFKSVSASQLTGFKNLEKLCVAEGFVSCGRNIVQNLASLRSVFLPSTISSFSYPVIGGGCYNLSEVSVCFGDGLPASFFAFDNSSEACERLTVSFKNAPSSDFFNDSCGKISRLSISFKSADLVDTSAMLSGLNNLTELELSAAHGFSGKLTDMISVGKLDFLWVDCPTLPSEFLAYVNVGGTIRLSGIKSFGGNVFEGANAGGLYICKDVPFTQSLADEISKSYITSVSYEGKRPSGVTLDSNISFYWEV